MSPRAPGRGPLCRLLLSGYIMENNKPPKESKPKLDALLKSDGTVLLSETASGIASAHSHTVQKQDTS